MVFLFGIGIGDSLGAADFHERFEDAVARNAQRTQSAAGFALVFNGRQKQVLAGNVLVFEVFRRGLRALD